MLQRREGRSLIYSVNFECMDALMGYLQENCCKGVSQLPSPSKALPARQHQKALG